MTTQQRRPELSKGIVIIAVLGIVNAALVMQAWISVPAIGYVSGIVSMLADYSINSEYSYISLASAISDITSSYKGSIGGTTGLCIILVYIAAFIQLVVFVGLVGYSIVALAKRRGFIGPMFCFSVLGCVFAALTIAALLYANVYLNSQLSSYTVSNFAIVQPSGWAWLALVVCAVMAVLLKMTKDGKVDVDRVDALVVDSVGAVAAKAKIEPVYATERATIACACGYKAPADFVFCPKCGAKVERPVKPVVRACPYCGVKAGDNARYCLKCGTRLGEYEQGRQSHERS